ncbi:MAG: hypothetical protein AVDCRST_MAG73-890, partial [uncultured Thermomicrobiales bacterium]
GPEPDRRSGSLRCRSRRRRLGRTRRRRSRPDLAARRRRV